jgi:hypothetical protein
VDSGQGLVYQDGGPTGYVGAFVLTLLPVKLAEGHTVSFGVWPSIPRT